VNNRVSVIIPSYNSAQFLPEAIESVLGQTHLPFEIIVVDDGSTDDTKAVCERYLTVQYLYQKNQGVAMARNTGMLASKGDYLIFLDSDDCLLSEAIEIGVNCIDAHPEVGFAFGRYFFYSIQPDNSYKVEETYEDQPEIATYETILATRHKIQCGCVVFRRAAIESVVIESAGAFDPRLVAMEDINLFLRVARDFPIYFHSQVVSKYRYTGNNLSSKSAKMLIIARHSHSLQWSYIQRSGNKAYEAAYEQGKLSWTKLFANRLPYEILKYVQAGQWIEALGALRLILYYDPKLKCVDQEIYEASRTALIAALQKLPIQSSLAYWKQQLVGAPPLLSLPTDRPRPAEQTLRGASQAFLISQELTTALDHLSKQEGVTRRMTLLAAFDTLIYRYTGTEDLIVGSPFVSHEDEKVFVNGVALRTDLSGNPSFRTLLRQVRKVVAAAAVHQDVPYCLLLEELNTPRDSSYAPLFQVTFVFEEDVPLQQVDLSVLTASPWVLENNEGKFDLTLFIKPTEHGLEGQWSYNTDLFNADTIVRLNEHFQTLLAGIVAHPEQSISELPLLTTQEKQKLLVDWNQTETDYPHEQCLHHLVAAQAERTPDRIAIGFEGQTITYKVLNERANQLAHYLQKTGVQPNSLVGICVERSLEMIVGLIGILKAGAAYVPIDPNFPPERVEYMLNNAQAKVLLTQQRLVAYLPTQGALVICLDTDWHLIAEAASTPPVSSVTPDNIAYVIYTSGSTGKPKGVQVLHRGVVNFLSSMAQQPGIAAADILLSVTTLSFDIAVLELFLPLTVGARVVLLTRAAAMDGRKLAKTIAELGITIMQATPATWRLLLEAGWAGNQQMKILSGGEAISRELAAELLEKGAALWNLYGPTETTIWSAVSQVIADERRVSIGKPIANTEIYILDALLQPVPIGVAGELHIGGVGLAQGYLKRPDLTAEKFIPNPFSEIAGARIYKTGDLARYLPNGTIECLGRLDFQVKVRGFRIELGEIESVLVSHPTVQQAVVIVREDVPGDKRLVGYIVALPNQMPTTPELRSLLKENVPEYMVPSAFVFLDVLPLTPNGKVDRKALPAPDLSELESIHFRRTNGSHSASETAQGGPDRPTLIAPQDDLDLQLIKIWEKVLHTAPIQMNDNFFELGGHSLLAISLLNEIVKTYKKELPLSALFQSPTVEKLASTLRSEGCDPSSQALVTIQQGSSKPPLFCIYGIFLYYDLARNLGEDQPVYGIYVKEEVDTAQSEKPEKSSASLVGIEDLATRYLKEIRMHQPVGPYFLAGESLGGLVAFEIAQQLHLQGEEVALLGLLDSAIPGKTHLLLQHRLQFHVRNLLREGLPYIVRKLQSRTQRTDAPMSNLDVRSEFRNYAFNSYIPQPYPGKVVLFRAMDESHFSTLKSWKELAVGGLEIHNIPGDHLGILQEPHVRILAEKLGACIDQAITVSGPKPQ
jgi:amino acid adenylation domain-containing protein